MRSRTLLLPLTAASLFAAAAAPAAEAATVLTPTKPCFARVPVRGSEPLSFTITGGTPGGRYQVSNPEGNIGFAAGNFDAAGNATNAIQNFSVPGGGIDPRKGQTVPLEVREFSGPYLNTLTGGGSATVTFAAMEISNRPYGARYAKRTWVMSGLTPLFGSGSLYATWVRNGHRKATKIARLGRPDACGYLRIKRSPSPSRSDGRWTIYVHVGKKLVKTHSTTWLWRQFH